jgi:hypothetical protein
LSRSIDGFQSRSLGTQAGRLRWTCLLGAY